MHPLQRLRVDNVAHVAPRLGRQRLINEDGGCVVLEARASHQRHVNRDDALLAVLLRRYAQHRAVGDLRRQLTRQHRVIDLPVARHCVITEERALCVAPEQAAHWWQTEGRGFREALTGAGNEMLRFVNWKDYAAQNQIVEVEATSKPHYFMVFIRSEFVRDAQFYNDESFSDDINIHDEAHDESWTEISGPLMVWHGQADCAEAAIKQAMCLYSASENEFFAVEVVDIYKE